MPKLAGTFTTESNRDMGTGSTKQETSQLLSWFAIYLDDDRVVVRALNADGLPTKISKVEEAKTFFADYAQENGHYCSTILPLLQSLRERLSSSGGDVSALEGREAAVFEALVLDQEHLPHLSRERRRELAVDMLADLPGSGEMAEEHRRKIASESIASRKNGDYEGALSLYGTMLRANPDDDHILFNVARVYFEKGDFAACRSYLRLALEHDPHFGEAEKFLKYLNEHKPQEHPEGRVHLRYHFKEPQPCQLTIEGRAVKALMVDVSEAGARIRLAKGADAQLAPGLEFMVTGVNGLLAAIVNGMKAQVVWASGDVCGAAFHINLDITTDEFKHIIAYTRLT